MKKNPISTRRIFPSSQIPPSSVISYGVFLLVFVTLVTFLLIRTSSQQDNLINMNSRLIDLEQKVQQSVTSSEVTVETLSDDLKEVNREIRKLWDLSNKRNKKRIATLEDQLKAIDSSITEIFTQSQEIRLISKEFSKSISDIKTRVAKIDTSSLSSSDFEIRIKELEEAVDSMDSFRRQTNQSIIKLKDELSTRRIFPSSQIPPSSVISYGVFLLVFVTLFTFLLIRTSSQQDNLINMNSRLIDLEQKVQQSVTSSEVTVETLSDDLKEVNREIRKLWDLSNKRNKKRIATLEDQLKAIDSSITEIFTQSQEIRLISKEFSKSISDIKTRVAKIDTSSLSSSDYEIRIKELEEAIDSMDSFRRQTNQSIIKLKDELSKVISEAESSESNSLLIEN